MLWIMAWHCGQLFIPRLKGIGVVDNGLVLWGR
jgi:hypothetical protein